MITKLLNKLEQALKDNQVKDVTQIISKINKRPQSPVVFFNVAKLCAEGSLWEPAKYNLEKALKEQPALAPKVTYWLDREPFLKAFDKALEIIDIAIHYNPSSVVLLSGKGVVLNKLQRFDESIQLFEAVLGMADTDRDVHALIGLGEAYFKTNRYHDSIGSGQMVLQFEPDNTHTYYQLGLSYIAIGNLVEGVAYLKKALELNPEHLGAHINLSQVMLKMGMFDEGWQHSEWRFHDDMENIAKFKLPLPRWLNQPVDGKHVFVWVDQGLGDQVMYCSMIQRLVDRGAKVTLMGERRLESTFRRSFPIENFYAFDAEGINAISESGDEFHFQCPMGTLPAFFIHSFDDFGAGEAFLKPDPKLVEKFHAELMQKFSGKKLIGFGWRGGVIATRNHARLINLPLWQDLLALPDCQFINFQYDTTKEELEYLDSAGVYTPEIDLRNDVESILAYMSALDLYITADNTNAHMAGAIGLPVWNLIPVAAEWRWFSDRNDSPWYSSMRLFRNPQLESWDECMVGVTSELSKLLAEE